MSLKVRRSVTAGELKLESRKMALEASPYGSSELATFSQMLPGTSALSFSVLYTATYSVGIILIPNYFPLLSLGMYRKQNGFFQWQPMAKET